MRFQQQPDKTILTLEENEEIRQVIIYSASYVKASLDKLGRLHITLK